ncbi:MAG: YIP1 family protein [Proteobacteria bacterium]|nr:YIP1 family protein [Pseudomonadota bacterium]
MQTNGMAGLFRLAIESLREPKRCLRIILDMVITMPELLQATALVAAISTFLSIGFLLVEPATVQTAFSVISSNPIPLFFMQIAVFICTAGIITFIGRLFKGVGTYKEALTALIWLQFIMFGISISQLIVITIFPGMYSIIAMVTLLLFIHLTVSFVMEIHGFTNIFAVISGIIATFFGVAFVFTIILVLLGITPEVMHNV